MDYKSTLNLPKTDFAMQAGLPKREPVMLEKWYEDKVYETVLEKNDGKPLYVLHDGPPYANGDIHLGTALNKTLKDFIVRYKNMSGFKAPYVPGWDTHGLPTELKARKKAGVSNSTAISDIELRKLCREFALGYLDEQRNSFKRLGGIGEWDNPYVTLRKEFEAKQIEIFSEMATKGLIYKGLKPVYWCPECETALAEAEIEYAEDPCHSIYVKFRVTDDKGLLTPMGADLSKTYFVIWTTTTWTLPANVAICVGPEFEYALVKSGDEYYVMATALTESAMQAAGKTDYEILGTLKGSDLEYMKTAHPFIDRTSLVIVGDHVTLESGTGCVHTAPGHGVEDYDVCHNHYPEIPIVVPVDSHGKMTEEAGQFAGLTTEEANKAIAQHLEDTGALFALQKIIHQYPHCWRCHQPVIFRATDQWFVSMDKNDLRTQALKAINEDVQWVPEWAKNRIGSMVAERPDWCISRQRSWGVPIPVFKCAKCGNTVATAETFDAVIKLFEEKGSDAWFTESPASYLPAGTACEVCGCTDLVPESDILDVWWESGVSHTSVCKKRPGLRFPADLYLEGSDQHRGWFQSSLLTSIGAYETAPYKAVMHCGFTVDENGHKMSKSLGNGIDPAEVMDKYGADVLRLWVASVDYSQDVSISQDILKRTSDTYRRFRNTFRFLLGVLNDFSRDDAVVEWDQLEPFDQWALVRLGRLLDEVNEAYDNFKFHHVYRLIYDYVVGDLSAVYLDALKDRLYSDAPDARSRRSAQTVLANVLEVLVRLLTPIISFTTEEVWQNYPKGLAESQDHPISVQLAGWPERGNFVPLVPEHEAERIEKRFEVVLAFRDEVTKALEEKRVEKAINKSQEAVVRATVPQAEYDVLTDFDEGFFEELLIVSKVAFERGDELTVEISVSDLDKCPRCWNFRVLGGNPHHPDVCERCGDALDAIG